MNAERARVTLDPSDWIPDSRHRPIRVQTRTKLELKPKPSALNPEPLTQTNEFPILGFRVSGLVLDTDRCVSHTSRTG